MKVNQVMTKNVACLCPTATVCEAAKLMQKHNIGSIPVCENDALVGIVTDRDIVVRTVANDGDPKTMQIKDLMTAQVVSVKSDADINEVSKLMTQKKIRRVPVLENGKLVGMVSLGDVATDAKYTTDVADTLSGISQPSDPAKYVLKNNSIKKDLKTFQGLFYCKYLIFRLKYN